MLENFIFARKFIKKYFFLLKKAQFSLNFQFKKLKICDFSHKNYEKIQISPNLISEFLADPYSMNPYLPGSSDSSFMSTSQPQFLPLNRQHSRSGHLMSNSANGPYSSGGSNGGRSPPPEMPLLSAIPPPGARKPLGKRPGTGEF